MRKVISVICSLFVAISTHAANALEKTAEFSVQLSAAVQENPARITLHWPKDSCSQPKSYSIYRKAPGANSWGRATILPGTATQYIDRNVVVGATYEYQVVKDTPRYTGYGYIYSGIDVPLTDSRGKLLLVVDNTYATQLTNELARLQQDLVGDGWQVVRKDVARKDSAANVKRQIKSQYDADPKNVKAVLLFGHVPVAYSGDIVPDGHCPDHRGAWPCDGFYGDMDGEWTDNTVNDLTASDARNRNVPGDGKYDQSSFPAPLKLMVGRVDLANMPGRLTYGGPATFPNELELLRNYLNKDHNFRQKQIDLPRRGIVGDYFGVRDGEAFAASGWRNLSTFFSAENVTTLPNEGTWIPTLSSNSYLWAYGCGPGSFTSIGGLGNTDKYHDGITTELVKADVKAAFTLLFGSWLGDWDSEDNLQRAVLALPTYGLTCACSGRPHWFLQHMALGEPIGFSARLTQNNRPGGLYENEQNNCASLIHIALMGDPTLRMHVVAPPSNVSLTEENNNVTLNWSASSEPVIGYHVYRAIEPNGPFTRLTASPVTCTSYTDSEIRVAPLCSYMVRAVKLETSASGTYYNASQGAFVNPVGEAGSSIAATSEPRSPAPTGRNSNGHKLGELPPANTTTPVGGTNNSVRALSPTGASAITNNTVWINDSLPTGAVPMSNGGDSWNWVSSNPTAHTGTKAHQSSIGSGLHEHYFAWASQTLKVNSGETMVAYVYLDPANLPSEIMLSWYDNNWEHRAYWGADSISYGTPATAGHRYMGPLPPAGQWVRLEVPASQVALEGSTLGGMSFSQFNGRATWDSVGKASLIITNDPTSGGSTNTTPTNPTNSTTATVTNISLWVEDKLPNGAVPYTGGGDSWSWVNSNPAPFSGALAHQSTIAAGLHEHYFAWATQTMSVKTGETLVSYVYLDPNNSPNEIMLSWNDGTWEHRAYWGSDLISYGGASGTPGHRYMGPLPATGRWVRLEIPASQVALEGSTVSAMSFSQYDGRATWDAAGKATLVVTNNPGSGGVTNSTGSGGSGGSTNPVVVITNALPGASGVDYINLALPQVGSNALHVLTPNVLELKLINTKQPDPAQVTQWNFVNSGNFTAPSPGAFTVTANGQTIAVTGVGFKRRPIYAPFEMYDLRIDNSLYLQLASPISDGQAVEVKNPNGSLWASSMKFTATADPLRYSPAIHVNQEGYMPNYPKKAMVGYYLGNMGEMVVPFSGGFKIVDATTGAQVFQGTLNLRADVGFPQSAYQKVYEADFSGFNTPGQYRLLVPGMGASLPFLIDNGIAMNFARAYELGLYHQRCGTNTAMPYTRFTHPACHNAPASVPLPQSSYTFTWNTIAGYAQIHNSDNPVQTAPALTSPSAQLFPYVRQGPIDTTGGHHDAGDYSKYTINCARLVHLLMFQVDSLAGVGDLDNMGTPESGDGISDILQEAKWEADYIAKIQDSDGGFYFLTYPVNREYEAFVTPDHGDAQVVWPKTTSVTAASVAALAQCASSPAFKRAYPAAAAAYLQKAQLGWQFLMNAINKYGKNGAYQKITHYSDNFADQDELAWAACEMYLATGDQTIHQKLLSWFDPSSQSTWFWGWWHMFECYGNAIRSYAFAARNGRVSASALDSTFLAKCQNEIATMGDQALTWSQQSAYGTSLPTSTKAQQQPGWYFSADQAFDMAVAYQLNPKPDYIAAMIANMNYEGGCNPVNVAYITGMGWKRQRDIVSQWHSVTPQTLPPSGIPEGNVTGSFTYLFPYGGALENLCFPTDATGSPGYYPFYDRWGDSWNVNAEMVVLNQARGLGTLAFLAAQTSLKTQSWRAVSGQINGPSTPAQVGAPVTLSLSVPGIDLSKARITWDAPGQEPAFGSTFAFVPPGNGSQTVQAEAQLPDGRRIFAIGTVAATAANVPWVDDSVPAGGATSADGGDSWNWVSSSPGPFAGTAAHQSALASGLHEHYFQNATRTLSIGVGDTLYAYIYVDPANPPSEIMLSWNTGSSWEHRAYWGANLINYGSDGTASRYHVGPLPATGQWIKLQVPASQVGLEGTTVSGMSFSLYNGRATWDAAGVTSQPIGASFQPTNSLRVAALKISTGLQLSWASGPGHTYRIAYKNALQDQNWTTVGSDITANGATSSWVDTTSLGASQRFYVVAQID